MRRGQRRCALPRPRSRRRRAPVDPGCDRGRGRDGGLSEGRLLEAAARVRGTAGWVAEQREPVDVESGVEAVAARRALHVDGDPVLTRPPFVVDLEPRPSIAAGTSPGPGEWLRLALPDSRVVRFGESERPAVTELDGKQLVVVVRDAHRHAWQQAAVNELLTGADDAIVIEVGLPHWRPASAAGYLATFGGARVNLEAAAERMAEKQPAGL